MSTVEARRGSGWRKLLRRSDKPRDGYHRLTVAEVRRLTPDSVAITFAVPDELRETFRFHAGQHVGVRVHLDGTELRRTYSICAPSTSGTLRVGVRALPGGRMSGWLNETVRVGDVLEVMPPTGRFTLRPDPAAARHHVGVAAGSGITPVLSMLTTALEVEPDSRFTLLYGNRTEQSTMFLDDLRALAARHPERLRVLHFRDGEDGQDTDHVTYGPITPDRLTGLLPHLGPVDGWYLCGPEPMVDAVRGALADHGTPDDRVNLELFTQSRPTRTTTAATTITATLAGGVSTVDLSGNETVLEALLRAGTPAPFSCMGGECGTCKAKVLVGAVEMDRDNALEPDELDAGYVLTCQSHPTTAELHVDYDS
ncbi:2Fe-2S iron-sulfur cluster-binding protein [Actinokineospora sp. HUAS TT18]|uniref:2Fe-2S iron-sulfur cluster-binding protein n=1 Tax=Actinokineospora sp. HUAS TT18 TaxID=3447451 RepID=UPI003F51F4FB